jgi:hypothetical protein
MDLLKNTFDGIYLITCDKTSKERLDSFFESNKINRDDVQIVLFKTAKEKFETIYKDDKGITHSEIVGNAHNDVIKIALERNQKRILVFEDDARLTNMVPNEKLIKILNWIKNNDWDVFYLGHYTLGLQHHINNYIVRTLGSMGTHAVAYSQEIMKLLLQQKYDIAIDEILRVNAINYRMYASKPPVFYQYIAPPAVKNLRKYIFPSAKLEHWDNQINDLGLSFFYMIIIIPFIVILIGIYFNMRIGRRGAKHRTKFVRAN